MLSSDMYFLPFPLIVFNKVDLPTCRIPHKSNTGKLREVSFIKGCKVLFIIKYPYANLPVHWTISVNIEISAYSFKPEVKGENNPEFFIYYILTCT
jgi:hypothetical protein